MRRSFFHLLSFLKYKWEEEEIYAGIALRIFALSLAGLFVPLYVFATTKSLVDVFIFFIVYDVMHTVAAYLTYVLGFSFLGVRRSLTLSFFSTALFFLLLANAKSWLLDPQLMWVIAGLGGLSNGLFWVSYHTNFAFTAKKDTHSKIGRAYLVIQAANMLAPFFGGLLAATLGYAVLFQVALGLLFVAGLVFAFSRELEFKHFKEGSLKEEERAAFLLAGHQNFLFAVFWPLFAFLFIFRLVESIGLISTFSRAIALFGTATIGQEPEVKPISTAVNAACWVGKAFILTPIPVAFLNAIHNLAQTNIWIQIDSHVYQKAKRTPVVLAEREILIHLGSAFAGFCFLILYSFVSSTALTLTLLLGALTSLAYVVL